jgi:hypothetical protein
MDSMRSGSDIQASADDLHNKYFPKQGMPARLSSATNLIRSIERLGDALKKTAQINAEIDTSDVADRKTNKEALAAAMQTYDNSRKIIDSAYRTEGLANLITMARGTWASDGSHLPMEWRGAKTPPYSVKFHEGKKIVVKVVPREIPDVNSLQRGEPFTFLIKLKPDWMIRPAAGLSFIYSDEARYDVFSAEMNPDSTFSVGTSGKTDSRFSYGLTLSLTHRLLDWREQNGLVIWPIELSVNPSEDFKSVGVGFGVSYHLFKLGGGWLWTKKTVLDGQSIGSPLSSANDLKTKETYDRSTLYLSLGLSGWPGP